jgi:hypothetical protein
MSSIPSRFEYLLDTGFEFLFPILPRLRHSLYCALLCCDTYIVLQIITNFSIERRGRVVKTAASYS